MKDNDVQIYLVPSGDSHQSEYLAPCDERRGYICGFSGSAGFAAVTMDKAAIATDGRYFNQAEKQLDDQWTLLRQGVPDCPTWQDWVIGEASGKSVGVDATLLTAPEARKLSEKLSEKGGKLIPISSNLVDQVWGGDRPAKPQKTVFVLDNKLAGKEFSEKIADVRAFLTKKEGAGLILSMLDEVAWLFNLRGDDIPFNPVFFAYAVITHESCKLYIDDSKLGSDVKGHLGKTVSVCPYESIFEDLSDLKDGVQDKKIKYIISKQTSWALEQAIGKDNVKEILSTVAEAKAIKNATELEGMRKCHIRDSAALIEYFAWLEGQLLKGAEIDEVDGADELERLRSKGEHFRGLSFPTISSTGPNAAVIHYKPEKETCSVINPDHIYLCDSGAQYSDGTTDVTRTLHFTKPSDEERKAYTNVLKGHIALGRAVFPKGTSGFVLDILARQFLWADGKNYRHGTGHGVGSFLNVHEGPMGIGTHPSYMEVPMSEGNVVSNEPGYYKDGSYGFRIENLVEVVKKVENGFGDIPYYGFENLTMVPMARNLIDVDMLDAGEKGWLNTYHQQIVGHIMPFFENRNEQAIRWLVRETQPL